MQCSGNAGTLDGVSTGEHRHHAARRTGWMSRHGTGSGYAPCVPPIERKTPQHTVAVDNALWQKVKRVAAKRHERISDVIRRALVEYVDRYGHLDDAED